MKRPLEWCRIVEFSLQGEWNAAVRLSLCCEQLSMTGTTKKNQGHMIPDYGLSYFFLGVASLNVHLMKIVHALCRINVVLAKP